MIRAKFENDRQLSTLDLSQLITIKLTDGDGQETKYLTLNEEFLKILKGRLL